MKVVDDYNHKQALWKMSIRLEQNKRKRFLKWLLYLFAFPFVWLFYNIRDWRTALIFVIVFLVLSSEVWVPYLLGFIFNNMWLIGVGSACWIFWLGPGTPFLPLCIAITIAIKSLINKIKSKRK